MTAQLGRPARGIVAIAHRCPCGLPDVVATSPVVDGTIPFPTTYYLTCPRARSAVSTLESAGVMAEMGAELADDPELAAAYRQAHLAYLEARREVAARAGVEVPGQIEGVTAGGMPDRVKCLHVLVAHSLAAGPGVNPLGDRALELLRTARQDGEPWRCDTDCLMPTHESREDT